mgnify:CR=1 FL=1
MLPSLNKVAPINTWPQVRKLCTVVVDCNVLHIHTGVANLAAVTESLTASLKNI